MAQVAAMRRPGPALVFPIRLTIYVASFATGVVAWVLNVPQLYWMCGVLFFVPPVSWLLGRSEFQGVTVERSLPSAGYLGEVVTSRLTLRNHWPLPKLLLQAIESLPPGLTPASAEPAPVFLPPRGSDRLELGVRLGRRGHHTLPGIRLLGADLLGMFRMERLVPCESRILVYPRVIPLPSEHSLRQCSGGLLAEESVGRQGDGSGFFGIREYQPGDPLRHVHWRTAARLGRLAVVEWEAEESAEVVIALDSRAAVERPLGSATTLDLAAGLAASLASEVLVRGEGVRVIAGEGEAWEAQAGFGRRALPALLEKLALMRAGAGELLSDLLHVAGAGRSPGTILCCITSAPEPGLPGHMAALLALGLRPVVYGLATRESLAEWQGLREMLERGGIRVVLLEPGEETVRRLID